MNMPVEAKKNNIPVHVNEINFIKHLVSVHPSSGCCEMARALVAYTNVPVFDFQ